MLRLLLADDAYGLVTVLTRRELPPTARHPKLVQQVVDFDRLAEVVPFPRAHDVFCCLGTTIRTAGSPDAFSKVDFTYVHELARLGATHGARHFLLVSSLGANPRARVFYSRVKGKVEEAVRALPLHGLHIFRPSLLLGARAEVRPGERVAAAVAKLTTWAFIGPLAKYRPIEAAAVARAMVRVAREDRHGVSIYESDAIARLARA